MTAQTDTFLTAWTTAEQAGDTRTLVTDRGTRRLADIHLSFIAGTRGAPE
jgi:hypothetical protein